MPIRIIVFACYCICLSLSFAWAQPFRPIQSYGSRWKIESYVMGTVPTCSVTENYFLTTAGDTTIAGWPCVRLSRGQSYYCDWAGVSPCFALLTPGNAGYLHLDASGRLYEVEPNGTRYAILDFSLGVGDTMHTSHPQRGSVDYVVDSIDMVTFIDGIARRRQYLTAPQFTMSIPQAIWVEGIGDILHGPLPVSNLTNRQINLCFTEEGPLWKTKLGSQCPEDCEILSGQVGPEVDLWSVAPNPTASSWKLTCAETALGETLLLKVSDMRGKVVLEQSLMANAPIEFALPGAAPGLYIANIYSDAGQVWQVKLMKQ